ncbi:MAG TPA: hypothetical protein VGK99_02560 [Acidobacteriota bacterium]|jgi:hypothetical protein
MEKQPRLPVRLIAFIWFGAGIAYFAAEGFPNMFREWKDYAGLKGNLQKRDVMFPGSGECVTVVREKVPSGSIILLAGEMEDEKRVYLHHLLDYELYPTRTLFDTISNPGLKPEFTLLYPRVPAGFSFQNYEKLYESPQVVLLKNRKQ